MLKKLCATLLLSASVGAVLAQDTTPLPADTPQAQAAPVPIYYFYTYHRADGNRFVPGAGAFPNVPGYDVQLGAVPMWVVGGNVPGDIPRWQVRDALGFSQLVVRPVDAPVPGLLRSENPDERGEPASSLPVLAVTAGASGNIKSQDNPTSLTHPVPLLDGTVYLQVTYNGDVAIWRNNIELARLPLNGLRDARPVTSSTGLVALYVGATNQRYVHGILGDNYEGSGLAILRLTTSQFGVVTRTDLQGEDVFEGVAPFWADVNGDGTEDLVTTVSNSTVGSWIRVYLFDGTAFIGEVNSTPLGQGSRWLHQIAFAPFGPNGEQELVAVRTPHINGTVQFMRYNAATNALDTVAEADGYTSHIIGSINLDMVVAGDFNGDGQPEIVLPSQDRTRIVSLQHTTEGVREMWSLPVNGRIMTNLSAVTLPEGGLALAYGTDDGRLRVWLPDAVVPPTATPAP